MKYKALNNHLVVTPKGKRSDFDVSNNKNHTGIGVREKFLDGKKVLMSECIPFIIVSSSVKGLKAKDEVWVRNSSVNYIGGDVDNYWCEEKDVMLLKDKPYGDNVLCKDVIEKSNIILIDEVKNDICNAFVYHPGDVEYLKEGDYIAYNYRHKNILTIDKNKMFVIDKKYILAIIDQDEKTKKTK